MNIKKLTRTMTALIISCALTLQCTTGFAEYIRGTGYGESYKSVGADDCISENGAVIDTSADTVTIEPGGSATFGFYVPYGMSAVTVMYEDASGDVTIDMGEREYKIATLSGSGEDYLNFGDYLGIADQFYDYNNANQDGYDRDFLEHRGEYEVTVSSESGITLTELKFERELIPAPSLKRDIDISSEARATLSTVFIEKDSPVISVNGATRYVDNDDITKTPYSYKGRLYLPINTLAKALGYYHEDYPDKAYALMRGDGFEVVLLEGRCTLTTGVNDPVELDNEAIIYRNGKAWGAVRYFAELSGETVGYDNGLVVIDNKYTVEDVLTDESLHSYAMSFFTPYKESKLQGKTYYVAQNKSGASDSNPGTEDKPFATITQAADVAVAGDTVIVCEGVYREELKPQNDGTAANPITFKTKEGDRVVISANEVLGNWTREGSSDVWKTPMAWTLGTTRNQIFIDGKPLNEARYPNGPEVLNNEDILDNTWPVRGDFWKVDGTKTIKSSSLLWQDEEDYWKDAIYVGLFGHMYSYMTAKIASSTKGSLTLDSAEYSRPDSEWSSGAVSKGMDHGYIVGHMNCLDIPSEWIYEDGYLYMIFPEDATPNETEVEAKARQRVIDLNNRKYINVVGFETIGGGVRTDEAEMCMLNGLNMKYISHFIHIANAFKGSVDFPYNILDEDASVERGENGIYLSGTNDIVVNCNIDHSAGAGLYMTGLYSYVENNIMNDCGYACVQNAGCYITSRGYEDITKPIGGHSFYNNTIYNVGRSAMMISSAQTGSTYGHKSFIPIETAYNDLHGAFLASTDVGVTYEYGVQLDIDGYDSTLHHNYMYVDERIEPGDEAPQYCMVYHDEGSRGYTTYDNQLFTSNAALVPSMDFARQNRGQNNDNHTTGALSSSEAYSRMWANSEHIVPDGADNLHAGYFIEERPFYAGAMKDYRTFEDIEYTLNYDRYKAGQYNMTYRAMDAELSDGVTIDEKTGYAKFSANGQYIHFEDVSFPDKTETFVINFHGDSHYTKDNIEIIIGDSMANGEVYTQTVEANAYDTFDADKMSFTIEDISGVHDVWVKVTDYKSIQIGGIGVYDIIDPEITDPAYSAFMWAGEFDYESSESSAYLNVIYLGGQGYRKKLLGDARRGYYAKYEDVVLEKNSDLFTISARGESGVNYPTEVYVEAADSEKIVSTPVASFNIEGKNWNTHKQYITLKEELPAGKYDVYLKFPTQDATTKLFTVVNWGFRAKGSILEEFSDAKFKRYAGKYDAALSTADNEYPFRVCCLEYPEYETTSGITYTLPGTVVGYSDMTLSDTVTEFVVRYSAEDYLDGQTVEVRVGSLDSDPVASFVTEGTGYRNLKKQVFELNAPISAGTYDVYLTFVDDTSGEVKTCNLSWFGFN